jgi:hypothetical protein
MLISHGAPQKPRHCGIVTPSTAWSNDSGAMLLHDPPSVDAGEITDKGYINQRAVLERRARLVDMVYEPSPRAGVIDIDPAAVSHPRTLAS